MLTLISQCCFITYGNNYDRFVNKCQQLSWVSHTYVLDVTAYCDISEIQPSFYGDNLKILSIQFSNELHFARFFLSRIHILSHVYLVRLIPSQFLHITFIKQNKYTIECYKINIRDGYIIKHQKLFSKPCCCILFPYSVTHCCSPTSSQADLYHLCYGKHSCYLCKEVTTLMTTLMGFPLLLHNVYHWMNPT